MGGKSEITVNFTKKEVVVPVGSPKQDHRLPQSNLDLLFPPIVVCCFFCYKKHESFTFDSMVNILKKSLSQVLVPYYAFAGEMVANASGEPELFCNNRGVDFSEAYADVELRELDFYCTDEIIRDKMLPEMQQGVFCVQATELKCGGLVVACAFDHRVADAYSCNIFTLSWTEIATSKHISLLPTFQRSLLAPRCPINYDASMDSMYVAVSAPPPPEGAQTPKRISRVYHVDADQIDTLQSLANVMGDKRTKLEAFSAFIWKIANSEGFHTREASTLGILVDGRMRLSDGDLEMLQLTRSYFGNVLSTAFGNEASCGFKDRSLNQVADAVHEFIKPVATKDHFMDLVDWVEAHKPYPVMSKIYDATQEDNGHVMVVSSYLRLSMFEADFGWGKPVLGSFHLPRGVSGDVGYVYPMPSPARKGDWIVSMNMSEGQLDLIEELAASIFKPLTFDYLNIEGN